MTSCPWQLYLFAFTHLAMAIALMYVGIFGGGAVFSLMFASDECNIVEKMLCLYVGICCLYVFALFYTLTHGNKGEDPKLKRLAMYAANCTVATFCGVISFGSSTMGGVERRGLHIADMIYFFALYLILASATAGDNLVVRSTSPPVGLKCLNPKALNLLIAVMVPIKIFVLADFMDLFTFVTVADESMVTDLANALSSLMAILLFEVFLAAMFTVLYGDAKDQERFLFVVVAMMIISGLSLVPSAKYFQPGLIKQGWISMIVFLVLVIFAVVQGRKHQREGYETITTTEV